MRSQAIIWTSLKKNSKRHTYRMGYLNKCENGHGTGFFHTGKNKSVENPSERIEFM